MSKRPGDLGYAAGWCIHYRGIHKHDSCEAGVPYSTFRGDNFLKRTACQPCFLDEKGNSKPGAVPCEHLRRPTKEEIALHNKWLKERMNMMVVTQTTIAPWRKKHEGESFAETVECPICQGELHLSISSYNNHVHGHCKTPGCVSWME